MKLGVFTSITFQQHIIVVILCQTAKQYYEMVNWMAAIFQLKLSFMNYDYDQTEFSKSLLAGLFAGISATVLCLLFNAFTRYAIGFHLSEMINVSTIIFAMLILATLAGIIFYFFQHYIKNGRYVFQGVSIVLTALMVIGTQSIQRSAIPSLTIEFRELLTGIIIITALCVVFIIPFLYKHDYV